MKLKGRRKVDKRLKIDPQARFRHIIAVFTKESENGRATIQN